MRHNGSYISLLLTQLSGHPINDRRKRVSHEIIQLQALIMVFLMVLPPISTAASIEDEASKYYMESLSQKAFDNVEGIVQTLKPGDAIDATGLEWRFYKIKKWSKKMTVAVADGWVGGLSGGNFGAILGLGKFTGISEYYIYGEHVFGYVWGKVNVVPRYQVRTKAARITKSEYEILKEKKNKNIHAFAVKMDGVRTTLYFRSVHVKEVKELGRVPPIGEVTTEAAGRKDVKEYARTFVTLQRYEGVEAKLKQSKIGTDIWNVVNAIGGKYSTYDFGRRYVLEMDGYLKPHMKRTDYVWGKSSADGKFEVWPFGYLDNGSPIPKLALIFKNSKLYTIVENATKDRVVKKLAEIRNS